MSIRFDTKYIDDHYIEIYEKIFAEPVIMPKLITQNTSRDIINISYKLVFKFENIKIPDDVRRIKNSKRAEIRVFEEKTRLENTQDKADDILRKYHEEKLMEFLELYPEYRGVILEDNISSKVLNLFRR